MLRDKNIIKQKNNNLKLNIMGAYRLAIYFKWQIGLLFAYENHFIEIHLPLLKIMICTAYYANGVKIFNWDSDKLIKKELT